AVNAIPPSFASVSAASAELDKPAPGPIKHVFVIAFENHDSKQVYGSDDASYINQLMGKYAHAENFDDELPGDIPSEPHYVWMEAGTSTFSDVTFTDDAPLSASNSTGSRQHLVTELK